MSTEKNHSKSQGRFLRPLGTSERFYWIYDQLACTNFSVIAEIEGNHIVGIIEIGNG
jgi:hypothetical protein